MDEMMGFFALPSNEKTLATLCNHLGDVGLSISQEEMLMLIERRDESLIEHDRVEFGTPAITEIACAIANSPHIVQSNIPNTLIDLQDIFYSTRDKLPVDVSDSEIVAAMRNCFDAWEGDTGEIAALTSDELLTYSPEHTRLQEIEICEEYRIDDDEGREYVFNPNEWEYDDRADGWDEEKWNDDFNN